MRGDIRDLARLKSHLAWADAVVWLAALVGDGACSLDQNLTREINVESVRAMLRGFDRQVVFMSTCSVYGVHDEIVTEEPPLILLSLYAKTRLETECRF